MTAAIKIGIEADRLLSALPPDPEAPFLTEASYKRKVTRSQMRDRKIKIAYRRLAEDYLFKREWEAVVERARLTPRQRDVLDQRVLGVTFEEIGKKSKRTKQCAQQIFMQALKKIGRSLHVYPYAGLSEVYRTETRRGVSLG